jgi:hypothetical protein
MRIVRRSTSPSVSVTVSRASPPAVRRGIGSRTVCAPAARPVTRRRAIVSPERATRATREMRSGVRSPIRSTRRPVAVRTNRVEVGAAGAAGRPERPTVNVPASPPAPSEASATVSREPSLP